MSDFDADAFVFFGATGDLAYRQIFPALANLIRDEGFDLPIARARPPSPSPRYPPVPGSRQAMIASVTRLVSSGFFTGMETTPACSAG